MSGYLNLQDGQFSCDDLNLLLRDDELKSLKCPSRALLLSSFCAKESWYEPGMEGFAEKLEEYSASEPGDVEWGSRGRIVATNLGHIQITHWTPVEQIM